MPNKISFNFPPSSLNTDDGRELYSYLYQLVEQLNVCMGAIDDEQISGAMQGALNTISGLSKDIAKVGTNANEALINAIKAVNERSEQADTQMRKDFGDADELVLKTANEYADGQIGTAKEEIGGDILEVDTRLSGETEAIRQTIIGINVDYTALEARVAALEAAGDDLR